MNFCLHPESFRGGKYNPNVFKPGRNGNVTLVAALLVSTLDVFNGMSVYARPHPGPLPQERENHSPRFEPGDVPGLSLIHISEPTRLGMISYAVFCLKKKK